MKKKFILIILLGGFLLAVSFQNIHTVDFNFFGREWSLPLIILICLIFFFGFIAGFLYCMVSAATSKHLHEEKQHKKELKKLEKQQKVKPEKVNPEEKNGQP